MNIAQAKQQVKDAIEAYFEKDELGMYCVDPSKQRPLFLVGAPGIGKTAIMTQIADELGIGLVSYSMTHHTRQSALGLPFIVHRDFEGLEYDASEYTMSEIISSMYDYMKETGVRKGILFLDEINCVSETLYPSMLQFLQFKTFGRHRIPADWAVVCAGNPPEYNKSVHDFDVVTLDRLRKVAVEPDYQAWRDYAVDAQVHPAILSFLDVKKDCFYCVETTPEGKQFVTARGWEDLSQVIRLFERAGKAVDRDLISQYLQQVEIADRFSLYYELFRKYRSDYQIGEILEGRLNDGIRARANKAAFDERLAIAGLILDALVERCRNALDAESAVAVVRGALKAVKASLGEGASTIASLEERIAALEAQQAAQRAGGVKDETTLRSTIIALRALKEIEVACKTQDVADGAPAFEVMSERYRDMLDDLRQKVELAQSSIDNSYAFVDEAFDQAREVVVFTAELTARKVTAAFVTKFGADSYFAHNRDMQTRDVQDTLMERIADLDLGALIEQSEQAMKDSPVSLTPLKKRDRVPGQKPAAGQPVQEQAPSVAIDEQTLRPYYDSLNLEGGYYSLCRMDVPLHMEGKRVLNIGCRRGKGVYLMGERVGANGRVMGLDWNEAFLAEAAHGRDRAVRKAGLQVSNMDFRFGYPENLEIAGLSDNAFDLVFCNSILNLAYDVPTALKEILRVLKAGGTFRCQTVIASGPRNPQVVAEARTLCNVVQAAPAEQELLAMLERAGFAPATVKKLEPVTPDASAIPGQPAAVAAQADDATYTVAVIEAQKR